MDELIPLNLVIGDRNYRVRIQPKDEEVVRKTTKTINDKIVEFKTAFAGKDMQDYIAMVLVLFAGCDFRLHQSCGCVPVLLCHVRLLAEQIFLWPPVLFLSGLFRLLIRLL